MVIETWLLKHPVCVKAFLSFKQLQQPMTGSTYSNTHALNSGMSI